MSNRVANLAELGQSVWIDFISRDALRSGELAGYTSEGVVGLTSNPAIFEKAMTAGHAYDDDIRRLKSHGKSPLEIFDALSLADIATAADLLRPVYDRTGGLDGYVSVEVNPHMANSTADSISEARRLWDALARPNIMVKIPGTGAGIPAIKASIAAGININITLLFSIDAYTGAANAYIEGLESRVEAGLPVRNIASVASFFVSRVDTLVDKKLAGSARANELKGKAAIANARLAYARFQELFSGSRWEKLAANGARVQRPLWASTSTKDPSYPDTIYVDELIGKHTVNTMPPQTLAAFLDHGTVAATVTKDTAGAKRAIADLEAAGVSMAAVTDELLVQGVELFAEAFDRLEAALGEKVAAMA